jgi:hypothetical protein
MDTEHATDAGERRVHGLQAGVASAAVESGAHGPGVGFDLLVPVAHIGAAQPDRLQRGQGLIEFEQAFDALSKNNDTAAG